MFLVIFRSRKCADIDAAAYGADAARMEQLAKAQPGYLSFKSYVADDGESVAISEWESKEAARNWGREAEHGAVQSLGRSAYYQDYTMFACDNPRIHQFKRAS